MRWVGVGVVFGQGRRQLTGIEPAMCCDAGPSIEPESGWYTYIVSEISYVGLQGTS